MSALNRSKLVKAQENAGRFVNSVATAPAAVARLPRRGPRRGQEDSALVSYRGGGQIVATQMLGGGHGSIPFPSHTRWHLAPRRRPSTRQVLLPVGWWYVPICGVYRSRFTNLVRTVRRTVRRSQQALQRPFPFCLLFPFPFFPFSSVFPSRWQVVSQFQHFPVQGRVFGLLVRQIVLEALILCPKVSDEVVLCLAILPRLVECSL